MSYKLSAGISDRTRATVALSAFVIVLATILVVATAYRANAARQWPQGFPKPVDVACEDLNAYLFPDGVVPQELVPVFGTDADTEWSESWTGASWAPNGYICIREIGPELLPPQAAAEQPPSGGGGGGGGGASGTLSGTVLAGATYTATICLPGESVATGENWITYPAWNTGGFPYNSSTGVYTLVNGGIVDETFTATYTCY